MNYLLNDTTTNNSRRKSPCPTPHPKITLPSLTPQPEVRRTPSPIPPQNHSTSYKSHSSGQATIPITNRLLPLSLSNRCQRLTIKSGLISHSIDPSAALFIHDKAADLNGNRLREEWIEFLE
ncbi:hypothetical protein CDAR_281861 [Caerostris darwini]|uniref:Uncharacterized protein n=1 Tax=Caerostris darwini TaxID=1538125 RepID=A0AAV4WPM0_9ARAC|nr:hypothetical protein CDAR_281861 [Caerostris darwini]